MQRFMLKNIFLIGLATYFISINAQADTHLNITHVLVSSQATDNGYTIVLDMNVSNQSGKSLKSIKLQVNGPEFEISDKNGPMPVGYIGAASSTQFFWTLHTVVNPDYFLSNLPVMISGTAKHHAGHETDLNLYSVLRGE